jgi:antirestriction protein ArdC
MFTGKKAYYDIAKDQIVLPKLKSFKNSESYYSTLFHELVHSTGSEKRLGRKSITEMAEFGSEEYSIEELIAELGAAYLCSFTGILNKEIRNTVAYIDGWLSKLKNDKRFIVLASGQAQRAIDCIMNVSVSKEDQLEIVEEVAG